MKEKNRPIDIVLGIIAAILTPINFVSFSAFIPCFFRSFYFMWIGPLDIVNYSGFTESQIKTAFNDVMNYLWFNAPFKTGDLAYTSEEEAHFADCKPLFYLQLILMVTTFVLLLTYLILLNKKVLKEVRFLKLSPFSLGAIIGVSLLAVVGISAAIDFDLTFTLFHQIMFPGKANWVFDWNTEQIIRILPESFFLVTAIFIIGLVVVLSATTIILDVVISKKLRKRAIKNI